MFKTQVVNSRNIRKTLIYKIMRIIFILFLLFMVAMLFHLFGKDSSVEVFFRDSQTSVIRQVAILFIIIAAGGISFVGKSRLRNLQILGNIELDKKGFHFLSNDQTEYLKDWSEIRFITFEFFSSSNANNPRGCFNYLTFFGQQDVKTYEIVIENSLVKAELGEFLREINHKIPVKVKYVSLFKNMFRDRDFKLT
jgi:hypothetical protein